MFAFLYPFMSPRPAVAGGDPWLTLAITGAVLLGIVVFAWTALLRIRRDESKGSSLRLVTPREEPKAA